MRPGARVRSQTAGSVSVTPFRPPVGRSGGLPPGRQTPPEGACHHHLAAKDGVPASAVCRSLRSSLPGLCKRRLWHCCCEQSGAALAGGLRFFLSTASPRQPQRRPCRPWSVLERPGTRSVLDVASRLTCWACRCRSIAPQRRRSSPRSSSAARPGAGVAFRPQALSPPSL